MRRTMKLLGLMMVCLFMGGYAGVSHSAEPEITLRYAGDLPIGNHLTRGQEFFAKRVEEIGKGRVKVEVFPAGQLYTAKDYPKALPSGALDMAQCALDKWGGMVPAVTVLSLPFLFDSWSHIWRMADSKGGEAIKMEMEKANVRSLFWMQDSSSAFAAKEPLKKLDDFRGKRIRAFDEVSAHTIEALGGTPAYLSGGEVYMALQRGTIDGGISSFTSFVDRKYFEVTKHITVTPFMLPMYLGMMNLKKWNELPPDVQKIILTAGKETQEWGRKEIQKMDREALKVLKSKMEVYHLPKAEQESWRKACKPVYDLFLQKRGESGRELLELAGKAR